MTSVLLMVGLVAVFILLVIGGTLFIASGDIEAHDLHGYPEDPLTPAWGEAGNRPGPVTPARPVVLNYDQNSATALIAEHTGNVAYLRSAAASSLFTVRGSVVGDSMERPVHRAFSSKTTDNRQRPADHD